MNAPRPATHYRPGDRGPDPLAANVDWIHLLRCAAVLGVPVYRPDRTGALRRVTEPPAGKARQEPHQRPPLTRTAAQATTPPPRPAPPRRGASTTLRKEHP